uniref:Uncharacterized protein n=1 Tax=Eptatretus burgeri TaxID=7764 RepID=A0A8C4R048_EPTBU
MHNLPGPPHILYPLAGDFMHSALPRTYGTWWDHLSRWTPARCPKNPEWFKSRDFVELLFDQPVFPTGVSVFETYHPGYVVRILRPQPFLGHAFPHLVQTCLTDNSYSAARDRAGPIMLGDLPRGAPLVTSGGVFHLLDTCQHMRFLDISFCPLLDKAVAIQLRNSFPHISIKYTSSW